MRVRVRRLVCLLLMLMVFLSSGFSASALESLPELYCQAAFVIHPDTGLILYAKNPDLRAALLLACQNHDRHFGA